MAAKLHSAGPKASAARPSRATWVAAGQPSAAIKPWRRPTGNTDLHCASALIEGGPAQAVHGGPTTKALCLDRFAKQLGLRWPTISPSQASTIATLLSEDTRREDLTPEGCADDYVRATEQTHQFDPSAFVLIYKAPGLSDAQRARAVEAAAAVLQLAKITPAAGVWGIYARGRWDDQGFLDDEMPPQAHPTAAATWDQAELAAGNAFVADQPGQPSVEGELELVWR